VQDSFGKPQSFS